MLSPLALIYTFVLKPHYTHHYRKTSVQSKQSIIFTTKHFVPLPDIQYTNYSSNFVSLKTNLKKKKTNSTVTFNIFSEKLFFPSPFSTHRLYHTFDIQPIKHCKLSFCFHAAISPQKISGGKLSHHTPKYFIVNY